MGLLILFAAAVGLIVVVGVLGMVHAIRRPARRGYAAALARRLPTEPAELGLSGEAIGLRLADGTRTAGWLIEGHNVEAGAPTVVITHGWANSRYGSLNDVPPLAPLAARLLVYDLRAHGEHAGRQSSLGPVEVDDLLALVDQVERPGEPIVLFGSSLGAVVSMAAAARDLGQRQRIAGVIAAAPYERLGQAVAGQMRRWGCPPFPFMHLTMAHYGFWLRGFRTFDRADHAAQLSCPLLVLHGTDDPIVPVDAGRRIASSAPAGRFVAFPGAGHNRLHEFDRQLFDDAVRQFFEQLRIGRGAAMQPAGDDRR